MVDAGLAPGQRLNGWCAVMETWVFRQAGWNTNDPQAKAAIGRWGPPKLSTVHLLPRNGEVSVTILSAASYCATIGRLAKRVAQ